MSRIETITATVSAEDFSDLDFKIDKSRQDHALRGYALVWTTTSYKAGYPTATLVYCRCQCEGEAT